MNYPYQITVVDYQRLKESNEDIQFGHYFVFRQVREQKRFLTRLRLRKNPSVKEVFPLVNESFLKVGNDVRVKLLPRSLELVGCLVSNRDLYRAERDPVHLFIAVPNPPAELRLEVTWNESPFCQREVTLQDGMAIETFALLLPGRYSAKLTSGERQIGLPVNFTVAEYQLAPLTGRLVSHQLDRETQYLWFELTVDSYQQPFTEQLFVELIEAGKTITRVGLLPNAPGQYSGGLPLSGEQALRLCLIAATDPEKVAEVVIPGSRKRERQVSVVSELGQKFHFAMLPEAQAIPVRGGYLSKAEEVLETPLQVDEIVTHQRLLKVQVDIEALTLVHLDLLTGVYSTQSVGDVTAGSTVTVASRGSMSMTFVGGFVEGEPFEAYTTFIQPTHFDLSLDVPKTLKPRDNLVVRLGCKRIAGTLPVLVCVRDARLTATEMPAVSLGAAAKRNVEVAVADMDAWSFVGWEELANEKPALVLSGQGYKIIYEGGALTHFLLEHLNPPRPIAQVGGRGIDIFSLGARLTLSISSASDLSGNPPTILPPDLASLNDEILLGAAPEEGLSLEDLNLDDEILAGADLDEESNLEDLDVEILDEAYLDSAPPPRAPAPTAPPPMVAPPTANLMGRGVDTTKTTAPPTAAPSKSKPTPPQTRVEFPEMLFYGLVPVTETGYDLVLPVGEALTTWVVETFALRNGDWAQARTTVVVDRPVRLDLEVPPAVYPQDDVIGRLHVATVSGTARIRFHCDNQPVELRSGQLTLRDPEFIVTPTELEFSVKPGFYQALVEDLHTHDTDSVEITVQEPTKVKSYRKALRLLQKGESLQTTPGPSLLRRGEDAQQIPPLDKGEQVPHLDKGGLGVVSLRLLPTLDKPFDTLITATANYEHLCCEQTAAKILAATLMYLTASNDLRRRQAEQIIITGIAREQKMFRPGRGFAAYPNYDQISEYYTPKVVYYLWQLQPLEALPEISSNLRQAIRDGLKMADEVATAHGLQRIPERITRIEEAYTLSTLRTSPNPILSKEGRRGGSQEILQFIDSLLEFTGSEVRLRNASHRVADRTIMAYAAAILIASKDWQRGLPLANQVTQQFNAQGRLYSTVDSAAALALLQQLKLADIAIGTGQVHVNSKTMTLEEALSLEESLTSVEVIDGVAAVEVTYPHVEDWDSFGQPFPITIDFNSTGKKKQRFTLGNRLTLQVALPQGYRLGDIAHVVLPPCLSAIEGGAKVKRFSLDFAGRGELHIPLLVTSKLQGTQHFAVCVRNMFEEERASSTGLVAVTGDI